MAAGESSAWRILRSRNFGPYFVGNAASASGTWFQNLAASILVYRLTHSPFLLGVLNFCQFVPVLLLAPWAGTLADRVDRRKLVFATQLVSAALSAALAGLAWSGEATEWVVIGFAVALGLSLAVSQPADRSAHAGAPSASPRPARRSWAGTRRGSRSVSRAPREARRCASSRERTAPRAPREQEPKQAAERGSRPDPGSRSGPSLPSSRPGG